MSIITLTFILVLGANNIMQPITEPIAQNDYTYLHRRMNETHKNHELVRTLIHK